MKFGRYYFQSVPTKKAKQTFQYVGLSR